MPGLEIDVTAGSVEAIPLPAATGVMSVIPGRCWLYGWSVLESTGAAPATAQVLDAGIPLGFIGLAAGASATSNMPHTGIEVRGGLSVNVMAGSILGVLYVGYESP